MKNKPGPVRISFAAVYFLFIAVSIAAGFTPGKKIGMNFMQFSIELVKLLPIIFILIGLFDVWVKREFIEKHLGKDSGVLGYLWVILLASPIAGGLIPAFPVAYSLFSKGARLSLVFTFIGAAAVCRIPMTLFEASFLGVKFSLVRLGVSVPLVIFSSILLGRYLERKGYKVKDGE